MTMLIARKITILSVSLVAMLVSTSQAVSQAVGIPEGLVGIELLNFHESMMTNPGPARMLAPDGTNTYVVTIGTGHPGPNPFRSGPATAIIANGVPYVVDAGEGVMRAISRAATAHDQRFALELNPERLNCLFITHLHADHTFGLPSFVYGPWLLTATGQLQVFGPTGTQRMVEHIQEAYAEDVRERIVRQGLDPESWRARVTDITESGIVYEDENVRVEAMLHDHTTLDAFAYRFSTADRVVVVGGDGTYDERLVEIAQDADVFLMEVHTLHGLDQTPWGGAETLEEREEVVFSYHIRPAELAQLAREANVKTLVLYHEQYFTQPFDPDAMLNEVKRFYNGEIYSSRDGDVF